MRPNPLLMNHRRYGTSSYQSTRRRKPASKPALDFLNQAWVKTPAKWILAVALILLFLAWLMLGSFRFLLTKMPAFTGFPFGNRTYLVLVQNNAELRPTGGDITHYGELTFSHGLYTGVEWTEAEAQSELPLVLSALGQEEYTFEDANFDPDFSIAAQELMALYQVAHPDTELDGVLAVDYSFLESWLESTGPLFVEGYELTPETLFEDLIQEELAGPLFQKLMRRNLILPWRFRAMLNQFNIGFEEKHAVTYFTRARLNKLFTKRNWTGLLPQSDVGDFLAINEGNYSDVNTDRYLTRDVEYRLEVSTLTDVLGNPIITANLNVTLTHHGTWNPPFSGTHIAFLRSMVPIGSDMELGSTITEDREDVHVLGELVELAPGESVTYSYRYELPEYVWHNNEYVLHLHKQPGTQADRYRIVVEAPSGMGLQSQELTIHENVGFFESQLLTDQSLSFSLLADTLPPQLVDHTADSQSITLTFNESLDPSSAGNVQNYGGHALSLSSATVDGNVVTLTVDNAGSEDGNYNLDFTGLRDLHGNTLEADSISIYIPQEEPLTDDSENE